MVAPRPFSGGPWLDPQPEPDPELSQLSVHASGRYFVDGSGTPTRLESISLWLMGVHGTVAQQNTTMDTIAAHGFNAFVLMLMAHQDSVSWTPINEPNDIDDDPPLNTPGDFATPNDTYFDKQVDLVDRALERGLRVVLFIAYAGNAVAPDDGWAAEIEGSNTNTDMQNFGAYVRGKFTQPNVIIMYGGDRDLAEDLLQRYQALADGVQSVARDNMASAEWSTDSELVTDQAGFTYGANPSTADMTYDSSYTFSGAVVVPDASWRRTSPTIPTVAGEPAYYQYEGHSSPTRADVRRNAWWGFTAGAVGGNNYGPHIDIWSFQPGSVATRLADATVDDQLVRIELIASLSWHLMEPSGTAGSSPHGGSGSSTYCGRVLVVSGQGSGSTLITSCMASDGSQIVAYYPPAATGSFSLDLRSMAGDTAFAWVDPTSGDETAIATYPNSDSSRSFTTPGNNDSGTSDWVLVGRAA